MRAVFLFTGARFSTVAALHMRTTCAALILVWALFASAQQRDFSAVEIKATHVAGSVYMLQGEGGNIGVSAGPDGLLIVDDQFAPLAAKIEAALKQLNSGKL